MGSSTPLVSLSRSQRPVLLAGDVEVDLEAPTLRVHRAGQAAQLLDLPPTEHRLLVFLLRDAGLALSRAHICRGVWPEGAVDLRTVDQYVRRLRRSLQRVGLAEMVQTINRYGYRADPQGFVTPLSRGLPRVPASTVNPEFP
jgi:DNA-binding response OmpR family regulator